MGNCHPALTADFSYLCDRVMLNRIKQCCVVFEQQTQ